MAAIGDTSDRTQIVSDEIEAVVDDSADGAADANAQSTTAVAQDDLGAEDGLVYDGADVEAVEAAEAVEAVEAVEVGVGTFVGGRDMFTLETLTTLNRADVYDLVISDSITRDQAHLHFIASMYAGLIDKQASARSDANRSARRGGRKRGRSSRPRASPSEAC